MSIHVRVDAKEINVKRLSAYLGGVELSERRKSFFESGVLAFCVNVEKKEERKRERERERERQSE